MTNAKEEFLKHTNDKSVKCVQLWIGDPWLENTSVHNLPVNYSDEQCDDFLKSIDEDYIAGWDDEQELFGVIWYEDGTWSEREKYGDSEWWEHKKYPVTPVELLNV